MISDGFAKSYVMEDCVIDLKEISLRPLEKNAYLDQEEHAINTGCGKLVVAVQGDRSRPAIITYHDLGLNHVTNFESFFNFAYMRPLVNKFCVYHINAPGQEQGARPFKEDYIYPSMEELGQQIRDVVLHFQLKSFIGLGVGVGANILARFALAYPEKVDALCLVNCVSTSAGWIEWGYQKLNSRDLRSVGMTQRAVDYLMWHHFGWVTEERNQDLIHVYRQYFEQHPCPVNLALLIDSYIRRPDMAIHRQLDSFGRVSSHSIKVPVLNITGAFSPHVDETVTFNSRLDPASSSWMKIQDCGMILEEQPAKVVEAFRLFLQGNGYAVTISRLGPIRSTSSQFVTTRNMFSI